MQRAAEPGWSNPKVLTIFALIFVCGMTAGGAVMRAYLHSRISVVDRHDLAMENAARLGLEKLKTELQLSPEQVEFVSQQLDEYSKYYQNIEEERIDVALHGRQRILDRLNDEQKHKFKVLLTPPQMRASDH